MSGLAKKSPIKTLEVEIRPPKETPAIGKLCTLELALRAKESVYFKYVLFELVNERTDKRAIDKVTSRSRYLYRFNIEAQLEGKDEEQTKEFQIRIPVHKEPTRNDKFICIDWRLGCETVVTTSEDAKDLLGAKAPVLELSVE